ncbi:alcohol oxidase [Xylariomycetidae sp. FL2044]|nr:alcohol oxidase [Xylariomycetidae sp. FL2044]
MALHTELPEGITAVDVIVAGGKLTVIPGGTAGCVVAARLAEADPNLSVLVIESGPNGAGNPLVDYPALFLGNLAPTSTTAAFHKSKASPFVANREIFVPTSAVLGGGSAINMMMYNRAQRCDWDSWKTPGWSSEEILPFLKKVETYHGGTYRSLRAENAFVSAVVQTGYSEHEDLSSLDSCNGVQRAVRFVSPDGKRQDTASRYLQPLLGDGKHPNLHVLVESQVLRVIIENKKATGVVYEVKSKDTVARTIQANRMVVVACGALGTPAILERSGVGSPETLGRSGIPTTAAEIPGVGHQYGDHQYLVYPYLSSLTTEETMDSVITGGLSAEDMIRTKHRFLGWNAQDATCKLRPTETDVSSLGPQFKRMWEQDFRGVPSKPLVMMTLVSCYPGAPIGVPPGQYFGIASFTAYPVLSGHVHITGPEASDPLDFDTGFLSDEEGVDLVQHRWAYKKQREIARRMDVFRGELPSGHPPFPAHSKAACVKLDGPLTNVQDIEYSGEDDAIIDQWVRTNIGTPWRSLGTCKMAPLEEHGVVDQDLNVHGLANLKLADLSIVPKNVAANTANTAMVIGEKAASIFIKELGLA